VLPARRRWRRYASGRGRAGITDGSWLLRKVEIERRGSQLFTTQLPSGNTADVPTLLRLHVVGRNKRPWGFGSIPIGRVQPQDVPACTNDLVIAGYKPRTVRPCYRFFSTIMRAAVAAKMIVFAVRHAGCGG
jgi:hypothetical protein